MRKIPGTSYKFNIFISEDSTYELVLIHREKKILDKTHLKDKQEIVEFLIQFLQEQELSTPKNRIEYIVKEELKSVKPAEKTLKEHIVSSMIDQINPSNLKKILLMGLSCDKKLYN